MTSRPRGSLWLLGAALLLGLAVPGAIAQESEGSSVRGGELSPDHLEGIHRGLDWLEANMGPHGMRTRQAGEQQYRVASTSLAGLAFLASGSTYEEGPHAGAVRQATRYIIERALSGDGAQSWLEDGSVRNGYFIADAESGQGASGRMHAHGYATTFLAEVHGTIRQGVDERDTFRRQVRDVLEGAVDLIVASQTHRHGWGYQHVADVGSRSGRLADEGSVTVTQVEALRAARDAGIHVDPDVIAGALEYLRESAVELGSGSARDPHRVGFMYSLSMGQRRHSYELTAAAVATLYAAGVYDESDELLGLGLEYLRHQQEQASRTGTLAQAPMQWEYYGNFYAAQAMFQAGGEDWERWFPEVRSFYLERQRADGSWASPQYGDAYATATALLILQIPLRYLPIFQR